MITPVQPEDLSELEQLALINMSYSRLDTYDMCPSKYWFTYIQKEERVFGPAATLGNILHSVLEDHVGDELDYDQMLKTMHVHRESFDPDHEVGKELMTAGQVMLGEFIDRHEDEAFDIIGKELEFSLVIGSALVRGFIDLVIRDSNGVIKIIDYKSGKYEVAEKNIADNLQIGIYALAAAGMFPGEPVYAELYYLRSGRRKGHLFSTQDLERVYDDVLEKINHIINDRNFAATQQRWPCSFCDFRKTGACRTGVSRYGKGS